MVDSDPLAADDDDPFGAADAESPDENDDDPLEDAPQENDAAERGGDQGGGDRSDGTPATLVYGTVDEWLGQYWRFTYRRRVSSKGSATGRWRAHWWDTDEAVQRLTTLWLGWEKARLEPGLGMSLWWINHAAPHMTELLSHDGPFAGATDENNVGDPLPYLPSPAGLFKPDKRAE